MQRRLNALEPYLTQWLVLCEFVLLELHLQGRYIELQGLCNNLTKKEITGTAFVILARASSAIQYLSKQFLISA